MTIRRLTISVVAFAGLLANRQTAAGDLAGYVPHDPVVPGALEVGDVCDLAAALAPRPLRIEAAVEGLNRQVSAADLSAALAPAAEAYARADASDRLSLSANRREDAPWLMSHTSRAEE